jgi:hypothetical protein
MTPLIQGPHRTIGIAEWAGATSAWIGIVVRKTIIALLGLLLLFGSPALSAAAQDATPEPPNSLKASQPEAEPVTFYSENGNELATATLIGMERNWLEFDPGSEPQPGMEYVALTIAVENIAARGSVNVSTYQFTIQTQMGFVYTNAWIYGETVDPPLLSEDIALEGGETAEFTLVFAVYTDEPLAHLLWEPESPTHVQLVMAALEPQVEGMNPLDPDQGDAVTFYSVSGDDMAVLQVTGAERGWTGFDEGYGPEAGMEFIAVTVEVENVAGRGNVNISPYEFGLQTDLGFTYMPAWVSAESADPAVLVEDIQLAQGQSTSFTLVFAVFEGEGLGDVDWIPYASAQPVRLTLVNLTSV